MNRFERRIQQEEGRLTETGLIPCENRYNDIDVRFLIPCVSYGGKQ